MKYKIFKVINDRFAVWYKDIENDKNLLGVYKVIDLYTPTREARFGKRYKARKGQTQSILDSQAISAAISAFPSKKRSYVKPEDRETKIK